MYTHEDSPRSVETCRSSNALIVKEIVMQIICWYCLVFCVLRPWTRHFRGLQPLHLILQRFGPDYIAELLGVGFSCKSLISKFHVSIIIILFQDIRYG